MHSKGSLVRQGLPVAHLDHSLAHLVSGLALGQNSENQRAKQAFLTKKNSNFLSILSGPISNMVIRNQISNTKEIISKSNKSVLEQKLSNPKLAKDNTFSYQNQVTSSHWSKGPPSNGLYQTNNIPSLNLKLSNQVSISRDFIHIIWHNLSWGGI